MAIDGTDTSNGQREPRREPRYPAVRDVRINVNPSLLAVDLGGNTSPAQILNFSRGGLHLVVDTQIEEGDSVDIWVSVDIRPGDYLLHGHVCWVKQDRRMRTHTGIVLESAPGTAIDQWRKLFDAEGKLLPSG